MTKEAEEKLRAAAERYNNGLCCGYPGCTRRPVRREGVYGTPRYCDLPEHNYQSGFNARNGAPHPMDALLDERDRVIRDVYASGGATYREIASFEAFGIGFNRVAQICKGIVPAGRVAPIEQAG
jgi:hypothetical protein